MPARLDAVVKKSRVAYNSWSALSGIERGRKLLRVAEILRQRTDELALADSKDTNVCLSEVKEGNIPFAIDAFEFYGCLAQTAMTGTHMDLPHGGGGPNSFGYCRRESLGVCGAIGAWNYPTMIAAWKTAPALACGNTLVYKPSEFSPASAHLLGDILREAGVPEDVYQVVEGGGELGDALCRAPGIAKISFTGSVPTGKKVAAACAETLKHNTLELGGKSPFVIFEDADIDKAVDAAILANFCNTGQCCSNGSRVFVHADIIDEFEAALKKKIESDIVVGSPLDPATTMGPVIHRQHFDKVMAFIEASRADASCRFVTDQSTATYDSSSLIISPTVIHADSDEALVVREEVFGPVMAVLPFTSESEVIARANDTIYGLAAGVMTKDVSRAHRVAKQLDAGTLFVNNYNIYPMEMPFGPFKQSGYGKECGTQAIQSYTRIKSVFVDAE
eukprot:TRINITY_DN22061_c0_g1_i2.p1 TRINITY_DN22061_c0_g1~~TRINITY_DN22061_c0_g1_i2.p1  ORF type:complete len:464 (+),score=204.03 TRINITY_DN22061_c0_g1_i2:50-1393(+)